MNLEVEEFSKVQNFDDKELKDFNLNFKNPIQDSFRIGQDIGSVSEYDLVVESGKNRVLGHHAKRFVRLYKGYFYELLSSIKRQYPKHSYVTYLNESDICHYDLCPNNISVLLKQINANGGREFLHDDKQLYNEKLVSRILSFFKCKTVYNEIMTVGENEYVLSVDFVKPNERYYPLSSLDSGIEINAFNKIWKIMMSLDERLKSLSSILIDEGNNNKIKADIKNIKSEFLYMYIVRGIFLGDLDFDDKNVGYIYNKENNYVKLGPTLDFEYCFMTDKCLGLKEVLEYAKGQYPEVYLKFEYFLEQFSKRSFPLFKHNFELIVNRYIQNADMANEYISFLKNNTNYALQVCKEISEKQKTII